MKVSIIIPVYNEESTIGDVLRRAAAQEFDAERELVVVDDGSTDTTSEEIRKFMKDRGDLIRVHSSLINIGKGVSVRIGLEQATGDVVLIQDADKELDPDDIPDILKPILSGGADAVYGSRLLDGKGKMFLKGFLANKFIVLLVNILYGSRLSDVETGYKAFSKSLSDRMNLKSIGFEWEVEITAKLLRLGANISEVPVYYNPRTPFEGKTIGFWDGVKAIYYILKYRFLKLEKIVKSRPSP